MRKTRTALMAAMLVLLLGLTALAAGPVLTLRAEEPLPQQVAALKAYLGQLAPQEKQAWLEGLDTLLKEEQGALALHFADMPDSQEGMVYIVSSGKVYHSTDACRSLSRSKNIQEISLNEAQAMNRRACKVCGGH